MKNTHNKWLILAGALAAFGSLGTRANTITPFTLGFAPGTSIQYGADLSSGELHAGDGFTIFDIGGFVSFGPIAPLWVASSAPIGSPYNPPLPGGPDAAGLMNVTFTYQGPPIEHAFGPSLPLGSFIVNTTASFLITDDWVSKDHLLGVPGFIDGTISSGHTDQILVPSLVPPGPGVPDSGSTFVLLGLGLSTLAMFCRKRFA